jgi:hypothetical protein
MIAVIVLAIALLIFLLLAFAVVGKTSIFGAISRQDTFVRNFEVQARLKANDLANVKTLYAFLNAQTSGEKNKDLFDRDIDGFQQKFLDYFRSKQQVFVLQPDEYFTCCFKDGRWIFGCHSRTSTDYRCDPSNPRYRNEDFLGEVKFKNNIFSVHKIKPLEVLIN